MNSEVGLRTVEAVYGILVKYSSVRVETFTAANVASDRVKHDCTPVDITCNNTYVHTLT